MSIASALGISEEQLLGKPRVCRNCKWYAKYEGVCVNGDSKYVAEFVDDDYSCERFEGRIMEEDDNERT